MATSFKAIGKAAWSPERTKPKGTGFSATYKVFIPFEPDKAGYQSRRSPTGKEAQAWRRKWKNLIALCKGFKKAGIKYEVEYTLRAEVPYAVILAGDACKQFELKLAEAA